MIVLWVFLGAALVVALFVISIYNGLVGGRNQVKNAWSQIDVQLKRRYDLIPNLVETAKGYMKHERETLERITEARSRAMGAGGVGEKGKAEGMLSEAMNKFFLVVENYPDLKANQSFLSVQEELKSTENRIAFSRQNYNDQALHFNNQVQMFPSNLIAGSFGFALAEYFQMENAAEKQNPKVSFS